MLSRGELTLLTPALLAQYEQDEKDRRKDIADRAAVLYADRPEILARHTTLPDPNDTSVETLPNGDYLVDLGGEGKAEDKVVTHGPHFSMAELVHATEAFNDVENQREVYKRWYESIDPVVRARLAMLTVEEVKDYPLREMIDYNHFIASELPLFLTVDPCPPPSDYSTWQAEVGADSNVGGDIYPLPPNLPDHALG